MDMRVITNGGVINALSINEKNVIFEGTDASISKENHFSMLFKNVTVNGISKMENLSRILPRAFKITSVKVPVPVLDDSTDDWCEIKSIEFLENGVVGYTLPECSFGNYTIQTVKLPNGNTENVRGDIFFAIAKQTREQDRIDALIDGIDAHYMDCMSDNIEAFLLADESIATAAADAFAENVEYSGSEEFEACVNVCIKYGNVDRYKAISNAGIADEQTDYVWLLRKHAEKIQKAIEKRQNGTKIAEDSEGYLTTEFCEKIAVAYISQLTQA